MIDTVLCVDIAILLRVRSISAHHCNRRGGIALLNLHQHSQLYDERWRCAKHRNRPAPFSDLLYTPARTRLSRMPRLVDACDWNALHPNGISESVHIEPAARNGARHENPFYQLRLAI